MNKTKKIFYELRQHAPFTALATLIAIITVIFLIYGINQKITHDFFFHTHSFHILISAVATAGIFHKYTKRFYGAIFVGALGAIIIGSLSDVIFPYLGALVLGIPIKFDLPILNHTSLIIFLAIMGGVAGSALLGKTRFPHFFHVLLSVFASLFYLLEFITPFNLIYFIATFFIVFIAVVIPCCLSDIIFPFFFIKDK